MSTPLIGVLWALESAFARLAQKKKLAILVAGLLPLVVRALLLPVLPVPRPAIMDEFSYLLAGDTFASGRLVNPTPAFAEHFETIHELIRPVYASKYPPLQGLVLAAGQKLTGQPWTGVWLSMGVMCAVLCWAMQGWLPAVWALAGSLIAALHIGIVSYWSEGYWGGACAAVGGALLIGAAPRLMDKLAPGPALAYAAGLAILANTRPFEGLVFAVVATAWLAFELAHRRASIEMVLKNVVLPMALLLVPVAACMAYYNYRITGHALELPYVAHDKQYALREPLLWETTDRPKPVYSNAYLEEFWRADRDAKQKAQHEIVSSRVWDLSILVGFLIGWPLAAFIILGAARPLWRDPVARRALLLGAVAYAGPAFDSRLYPHYAAAEAVLVYIVAACGLRALRNAWPGADGAYLMWAAVLVFVLPTVLGLTTPANRCFIGAAEYLDARHAAIDEQLERQPGEHLVLVRYGPAFLAAVRDHKNFQELVYNHADIDGSKVVWARSLGAEKDEELIRHYPNREVWMVEQDTQVTLSRGVRYSPLLQATN